MSEDLRPGSAPGINGKMGDPQLRLGRIQVIDPDLTLFRLSIQLRMGCVRNCNHCNKSKGREWWSVSEGYWVCLNLYHQPKLVGSKMGKQIAKKSEQSTANFPFQMRSGSELWSVDKREKDFASSVLRSCYKLFLWERVEEGGARLCEGDAEGSPPPYKAADHVSSLTNIE
ncbi:unnamed protein product [Citrullus colocynthis]|uniref:Uncharacterized protein n=1 Tax=Citrullus colocynthis TaxID=252529 RepID=A0ABP0YZB1_9ROSI